MGMFDDIKCEYPLPSHARMGTAFQTKDLECEMEIYRIDREGNLWRKHSSFDIRNSYEEELSTHTGWINFYDGESYDKYGNRKDWNNKNDIKYYTKFSFKAEFFRGKLQALVDESYVEIWEVNPITKNYISPNGQGKERITMQEWNSLVSAWDADNNKESAKQTNNREG